MSRCSDRACVSASNISPYKYFLRQFDKIKYDIVSLTETHKSFYTYYDIIARMDRLKDDLIRRVVRMKNERDCACESIQ